MNFYENFEGRVGQDFNLNNYPINTLEQWRASLNNSLTNGFIYAIVDGKLAKISTDDPNYNKYFSNINKLLQDRIGYLTVRADYRKGNPIMYHFVDDDGQEADIMLDSNDVNYQKAYNQQIAKYNGSADKNISEEEIDSIMNQVYRDNDLDKQTDEIMRSVYNKDNSEDISAPQNELDSKLPKIEDPTCVIFRDGGTVWVVGNVIPYEIRNLDSPLIKTAGEEGLRVKLMNPALRESSFGVGSKLVTIDANGQITVDAEDAEYHGSFDKNIDLQSTASELSLNDILSCVDNDDFDSLRALVDIYGIDAVIGKMDSEVFEPIKAVPKNEWTKEQEDLVKKYNRFCAMSRNLNTNNLDKSAPEDENINVKQILEYAKNNDVDKIAAILATFGYFNVKDKMSDEIGKIYQQIPAEEQTPEQKESVNNYYKFLDISNRLYDDKGNLKSQDTGSLDVIHQDPMKRSFKVTARHEAEPPLLNKFKKIAKGAFIVVTAGLLALATAAAVKMCDRFNKNDVVVSLPSITRTMDNRSLGSNDVSVYSEEINKVLDDQVVNTDQDMSVSLKDVGPGDIGYTNAYDAASHTNGVTLNEYFRDNPVEGGYYVHDVDTHETQVVDPQQFNDVDYMNELKEDGSKMVHIEDAWFNPSDMIGYNNGGRSK